MYVSIHVNVHVQYKFMYINFKILNCNDYELNI